ncbi:MAG TPA: hypothetical protein VFH27_12690 [Longimicrobiaceae bacterium]|nr:hypothetical protein [Longimicrobiaceae bacterium]
MSRTINRLLVGALALGAAACAEGLTDAQTRAFEDAFLSAPLGLSSTTSTFSASTSGDAAGPWMPEGDRHRGGGGRGHHGPGDGLMGGGIDGLFMGGGFGPGFGRGHFGDPVLQGTCAFDAATGRVACAPQTRDGLTITRSAAYATASGTAQSAFDSVTTNSINVRVTVTGTVTRRNGLTSTIQSASDRTVAGLAAGSTQRTVNGTSAGTENTTGTDSAGATFTAVRTAGDTTTNVVIPVSTTSTPSFPTAGTVIRSMKVTVTYASQAPVTSTRREVLTYDGTSTAKLVITRDGTTRTCTVPLPHGRPTCQ